MRVEDKLIEVQCRTEIQHLWSQLSESLADTIDSAIKYGGGSNEVKAVLDQATELIVEIEADEARAEIDETRAEIDERVETDPYKSALKTLLKDFIDMASRSKER